MVRVLRLLARLGLNITFQSSSWEADLSTLMCARYLVAARSSLQPLLAANSRLRRLFVPTRRSALSLWATSCEARVCWAAEREDDLGIPRFWNASSEQLLGLILGGARWQVNFTCATLRQTAVC